MATSLNTGMATMNPVMERAAEAFLFPVYFSRVVAIFWQALDFSRYSPKMVPKITSSPMLLQVPPKPPTRPSMVPLVPRPLVRPMNSPAISMQIKGPYFVLIINANMRTRPTTNMITFILSSLRFPPFLHPFGFLGLCCTRPVIFSSGHTATGPLHLLHGHILGRPPAYRAPYDPGLWPLSGAGRFLLPALPVPRFSYPDRW